MRRLSLAFGLALLVSLGGLTPPARLCAQKEFGFDNRKASGQPYLKAEETVAKFKVADEFEVKLFAGEPQVTNPVAFTIDEKGRVWVVECFEYPKRTPKGKAPRDRIVILEDTDGDGVCDKRTVFAEGKDFPVPEERKKAGLGAFDLCTGIEVGHGGVFVGAAPYLWFIENKDGKAGKFEVLLKGFGSQDTHETLNTFQWGPDGWLYGLHGVFTHSNVSEASGGREAPDGKNQGADAPRSPVRMNAAVWRYHPKQKKFEIFSEGTSNPWGMDWRNTDGQFILCCCVIPHLYHMVPGGIYKRQAGTAFHPFHYGYLNEICDHTFHKESGWAHAGLISLDVPHMPKRFQNSVIFGSIHGCSIKQNILEPKGSTYLAKRGDDFLVSGDKNFRPINMKWGPAGDIYLIDWHDQNPCHQTNPDDWDYDRGRVYRIQLKGTKTKKAEDLGKKTLNDLQRLTGEDDPYTARTALRLLSERGDKAMSKEERKTDTFWSFASDEARGTPLYEVALVQDWLKRDPVKQAHAIRVISTRYEHYDKLWNALLAIAATTTNAGIRRELASAAIRLSEKHDVTPLVRALMARKEDARDPVIPQLVWLAYERVLASGGRKPADKPKENRKPDDNQGADAPRSPVADELAWLADEAPKNEFVRDQIVPRVMRRLVATGQAADLKLCVEFVAKLKDAASREKALEGLTVALDKQTVDAPEGWAALKDEIAKDKNPKLVALANKLAVNFRDPAAVERATKVLRDSTQPDEARIEAVRQLALLKAPNGDKLFMTVMRQGFPLPVKLEAARGLAAFDDPKLPGDVFKDWTKYPPTLQAELVGVFAGRKEWARELLREIEAKTVDRRTLTDNTVLKIQAFKDKELDALIEKAWGRSRPTPAELAKIIDKTRGSLHEAPASFERGRKVFETNCAKCHKFDGKGEEVGPPLDGAGRDIEYILGNVLDPNRVIGAPYFVRTARLLDDTVFTGLLAEEDDTFITLKLENAVLKKIKKTDLNGEVRVAEKSLMPEGLGYNMSAQDFRDLVRYLMANPFVTDVSVNGTKLAVGAPGRLALPDNKGESQVVEAEVNATDEVKTKILIGSTADYEVRLNGKAIGTGKGAGKDLRPDRDSFDVTLPAGKHTLAVVVKGGAGNALYARFLDPDRKLRYPDAGEKK